MWAVLDMSSGKLSMWENAWLLSHIPRGVVRNISWTLPLTDLSEHWEYFNKKTMSDWNFQEMKLHRYTNPMQKHKKYDIQKQGNMTTPKVNSIPMDTNSTEVDKA
jgi:hypothetical protein